MPSRRQKPRLPLWRKITEALRGMLTLSSRRYLCDSCKWDYGNACTRPERPNALVCPDYKRK